MTEASTKKVRDMEQNDLVGGDHLNGDISLRINVVVRLWCILPARLWISDTYYVTGSLFFTAG